MLCFSHVRPWCMHLHRHLAVTEVRSLTVVACPAPPHTFRSTNLMCRRCTADDATVHRHLAPEELRALAAHALVGAAHSFSQAATADYRTKMGPPQVRRERLPG